MAASTTNNGGESKTNTNDIDDGEWNDVTDIFDSITSKMDLGQMIHANDFNLHSAMSALEIGDGVLDAAMEERILYIENVLDDQQLLTKMFNVENDNNNCVLLGVLDELLRLLWSFFNGNSDQFSIYSCLYLYDQVRQHSLNKNTSTIYLFIDSIKLCCGYAREIVKLSGISEDEDWSKQQDFELNDFKNVDNIIKELQNKINELKNCKSDDANNDKNGNMKLSENSDSSKNGTEEQKNGGDVDDGKEEKKDGDKDKKREYSKGEYIQAMSYRFEFIAGLLNIIREMYNVANTLKLDDEKKEDKESKDNKENNNTQNNGNNTQNNGNKRKQGNKSPNKTSKGKPNSPQRKNRKGGQGGGGKKKGSQGKKQPKGRGGKGAPKGGGKGGKGGGGKGGKGGNNNNQQSKPSKSEKQKEKLRQEEERKNGMMYLIDNDEQLTRTTLSNQKLTAHKTGIQNFKQLSSGLLRIVNHLVETESMGEIKDKLSGFDTRLGNNKSVHAPRRQRIPSRNECFQLFNQWCKGIRFMTNMTKLTSYDGFLEYLDAFNRLNVFPNVIIRAFITIIIEQFVSYNCFLWSKEPLVHYIQLSFASFCEWARIFPTTNKQYLGDYHTFFTRVETAIRDIVKQKLLHISRQSDWSKRIIKNWQILQNESPEIDKLTCISYLSGFDEKYHEQIKQLNDYKPMQTAYTGWIYRSCCESMINHIFIHLSKHMQLYADYELEYVYYYLQYLFKENVQTIELSFRRYHKINMEKLNEIVNPNYAQMKQRRKKKGKGNVKNKETKEEEKLPPIDKKDKYIYLINEAQRTLCLALFELIQTFYQINKENKNKIEIKWKGLSDRIDDDDDKNNDDGDNKIQQRLGDESLRYSHRFNVFGFVDQPMMQNYRLFRTEMYKKNKQYPNLSDKFKQCEANFDKSRKCFALLQNNDKFKEIPSYQEDYIRDACKVAIKNKIFATQLNKIVDNNKDDLCVINIKHQYEIHPFYLVFNIEQKK